MNMKNMPSNTANEKPQTSREKKMNRKERKELVGWLKDNFLHAPDFNLQPGVTREMFDKFIENEATDEQLLQAEEQLNSLGKAKAYMEVERPHVVHRRPLTLDDIEKNMK